MRRIEEIIERRNQIRAEVEGNPEMSAEELNQRNQELDQLRTEQDAIEARQRLIDNMQRGRGESKPQGNPTAGSEIEQRAQTLRSQHSIRLDLVGEQRAITLGSSGMVKPTNNASTVNPDPSVQVSSIVDMVTALDLGGMSEYVVPYQVGVGEAAKTTENSDAGHGNAEPVFKYAAIKPVTLTTYGEISREVMKLTDVDYYNQILDSARIALRKKVAEYIINSDAEMSATFIGITAADALEASDDVELAGIDATTLRKIAMNYGGEEGIEGNAVLFLNKKDLIAFGDVRGTSEKRAVYEITPDAANPNVGIIRDGGLSVRYCLNASLVDLAKQTTGKYSMIYGVPSCYSLGIFSPYSVRVSEDYAFKKRMIAILGEVMVGGNVTMHRGFVRVKKAAG